MGRATARSDVPFRFVLNHSNATAANVYLLLYPKPRLQAALKDNPLLTVNVWEALRSITGDMLMGEGRIYGGGLHKMEPRELSNVPADPVLSTIGQSASEFRIDSQLELFPSSL